MALVELQNRGILKYLISQNCDGLHRRSGMLPVSSFDLLVIPTLTVPRKTSQSYTVTAILKPVKSAIKSIFEVSQDCNHTNLPSLLHRSDFRAVSTWENGIHDHRTGRKCARCGGTLIDTIINFGENLYEKPLKLARQNAQKADLCLVLGSSLTITPANTIPHSVGERKGGTLAICNLQETPSDDVADFRIFSEADILMTKVMEKLDLPIPEFILRRRLTVKVESQEEDRHKVTATGVDGDGTPHNFLKSVRLEGSRRVARAEPFTIHVRDVLQPGAQLKLELEFMGHYNEPNLELAYQVEGEEEALYLLEYNPQTGEWAVERQKSLEEAIEVVVLDL
jgi:mono-ADP-ribosyltransferase sirtuin 6